MADRRKTLEALVAKRKAETESANARRNNKQIKSSSSSPASSAVAKNHHSSKSSSSISGKPHSKPSLLSPLLKKSKDSPVKKQKATTGAKTKKRVEKYESEDDSDDEDEDSDEDDDSDSDALKKKKKISSKGASAKGGLSVKDTSSSSGLKGKPVENSRSLLKEKTLPLQKVKAKKKHRDSSEESSDEDEGGREVSKGEASDDGDEGLDLSNVISDRTRRRSSQPVHYDFPEGSDDDDDSE